MRIAEQLGATTVTLTGQRMSDEILAFARARNVSKIVVGKPSRRLWKRIVFGSIVDALVEGSGEADVYVISGEAESPPVAVPRPRRPAAADWWPYGQAVAVVAAATGLAWIMFPFFQLASIIMVYLLGVILVATRHGRGPSFLASLLSVLAFDFFFVPPYLTFAVSDAEYLITFAVMLLAGFVISGLTVRIRTQAEAARQREQQTAALYAMSREFASTRELDALLDIAVRHISEVFRSQVVLLLPDAGGSLAPRGGAQFDVDANEIAVARWVYEHRHAAGLGTTTLPGARALYVPLMAPRGPVGVLGIRPRSADEFDTPERRTSWRPSPTRPRWPSSGRAWPRRPRAPRSRPRRSACATPCSAPCRTTCGRRSPPSAAPSARFSTSARAWATRRVASCWTRRARRPSGSADWSATCSR